MSPLPNRLGSPRASGIQSERFERDDEHTQLAIEEDQNTHGLRKDDDSDDSNGNITNKISPTPPSSPIAISSSLQLGNVPQLTSDAKIDAKRINDIRNALIKRTNAQSVSPVLEHTEALEVRLRPGVAIVDNDAVLLLGKGSQPKIVVRKDEPTGDDMVCFMITKTQRKWPFAFDLAIVAGVTAFVALFGILNLTENLHNIRTLWVEHEL